MLVLETNNLIFFVGLFVVLIVCSHAFFLFVGVVRLFMLSFLNMFLIFMFY